MLLAKALIALSIAIAWPVVAAPPTLPDYPAPQLARLSPPVEQAAPLQQQIRQAVASGDYAAALPLALKLADEFEATRPAEDLDRLRTRFNAAVVAQLAGDLAVAEQQYRTVIEPLRASGNFRDPKLARPLFGLGSVLLQQGNIPEALEALENAAFIVRADKGLYSTEQVAWDNALMAGLFASGRVDDAVARQKVRLNIYRKALGEDDPELLGALGEAAEWFRILRQFREEVAVQEERLEILKARHGDESPELVLAYYDLARSYERLLQTDIDGLKSAMSLEFNDQFGRRSLFVGSPRQRWPNDNLNEPSSRDRQLLEYERKAITALKKALRIQRDAGVSPEEEAETLALIGDHYTMVEQRRDARRYYRKAYRLLSKAGKTEAVQALFGKPLLLYSAPLPAPSDRSPATLAAYSGEADIKADIRRDGEVRDVRVMAVRPPEAKALKSRIRRYAGKSLFRPVWHEDGPVTLENYEFVYPIQAAPEG